MLLTASEIEGLRVSAVENLVAFAGNDNSAGNLSGLFC